MSEGPLDPWNQGHVVVTHGWPHQYPSILSSIQYPVQPRDLLLSAQTQAEERSRLCDSSSTPRPLESDAALSINYQPAFMTARYLFALQEKQREASERRAALCLATLRPSALPVKVSAYMWRSFSSPAPSGGSTDCRTPPPLLQACWRLCQETEQSFSSPGGPGRAGVRITRWNRGSDSVITQAAI